jgi:O-antigen/teichoic acid export membrane protein
MKETISERKELGTRTDSRLCISPGVLVSDKQHIAMSESTHFRARIVSSVLSNWAYLIVNAVVAFFLTPFVVRHLGDSNYGIWALVLQLTGYMGIVDVGLRSALVRFVSSAHAKKDLDGLNRLLSSTISLYAAMVPLLLLAGVLLSEFALPRMHLGPGILHTAQVTLLISALIVGCDFLFATFHASLAGLSRWNWINAVSISGILVRTVLIVVFIEAGYGLITLALIQLGVNLAAYLMEVWMIKSAVPSFRFVWKALDWERLRPVLQHSWYSLLLSFANRINYQVDTIVIAAFLPIEQVTLYVVGLRLIEYLRDLLNSTTMVASPVVSSLDAVGQSDRIGAILIRATKYSLTIGGLCAAAFLTLGTDFIRLWMGSRFAGPSGTVLTILTLGVCVSLTQYTSTHILYGLSQHKINLVWTLVESVLNLVLSIILIRRYGIFGVAAGTAIANLLVRGWLYPRAVLLKLGVRWSRYLREGILPAMPPALSFAVAVLCCKAFVPVNNYVELILISGLSLIPALVLLWKISFDSPDRDLVRAKIMQMAVRT